MFKKILLMVVMGSVSHSNFAMNLLAQKENAPRPIEFIDDLPHEKFNMPDDPLFAFENDSELEDDDLDSLKPQQPRQKFQPIPNTPIQKTTTSTDKPAAASLLYKIRRRELTPKDIADARAYFTKQKGPNEHDLRAQIARVHEETADAIAFAKANPIKPGRISPSAKGAKSLSGSNPSIAKTAGSGTIKIIK